MTQNSSNVEITDGIFIHNHDKGTVNLNSTVVNEQNGMTGASYESVVNRWFLTSVYAKVSRYCIDGFQMEPPMILSIMHPYVTQILAKLSLVKS